MAGGFVTLGERLALIVTIIIMIGLFVLFVAGLAADRDASAEDRARAMSKEWSPAPTCLSVQPKHEDMMFCVADRALIICANDGCLTVPLDAIAEKP